MNLLSNTSQASQYNVHHTERCQPNHEGPHPTDEEHHKHTSVNHEEPIAISAQRETRRTRRERIPESIPVKRCFRRNFLTRLFSGRSVGSSVVRLPYSSRRHTTYSTLSGTSSTVWFNYGTSSYCLLTVRHCP